MTNLRRSQGSQFFVFLGSRSSLLNAKFRRDYRVKRLLPGPPGRLSCDDDPADVYPALTALWPWRPASYASLSCDDDPPDVYPAMTPHRGLRVALE